MAVSPVTEAIKAAMAAGETDNEQIALFVRRTIPGTNTTAASVSSVKSRLRSEARMTGGVGLAGGDGATTPSYLLPEVDPLDDETVEEAAARISVRYRALERNAVRLVAGRVPALIVSGPPGLGKSYSFRRELISSGRLSWMDVEDQGDCGADPEDYVGSMKGPVQKDPLTGEMVQLPCPGLYDVISGSITAVGLYQALWNMRKGGVLMLDDVDEVFRDEVCLNLVKAALDSDPQHRHLSWRKEARWLEEYGIPKTFLFEGSVVFLTNVDFEEVIRKGHRDAEHFKALIDRSLYLCLTLRTQRDFMIRIRQVAEGPEGMLEKIHGLTPEQSAEVLDYVEENKNRFYNISLRLVGQVANAYMDDPDGWRDDIEATKMRTMS
jgi:hypothetical protein